jgi:hypothetical protein
MSGVPAMRNVVSHSPRELQSQIGPPEDRSDTKFTGAPFSNWYNRWAEAPRG